MKDKQIIYLAIILVVTLLAFQFDVLYHIFKEKRELYTSTMVSWKTSNVYLLKELIQEFGSPDQIDSNQGGFAIWERKTVYAKTGFLRKLVLNDVPNNPLYSYYHLIVPEHLVDAVNGIPNVVYNTEEQEVIAKCYSLGANYAGLNLAMKIVKGELTGYEAKNAYAKYVLKTDKDHPRYEPIAVDKYKWELKQYHDHHKVDCLPNEKNPDRCRA